MDLKSKIANEIDGDDCLKVYEYVFRKDLLKNKVAFITGGGSGIGFRITELLMRHGCKTAIASRKLERVKEAADKLTAATGVECLPLQLDVRNPSQVTNVVDKILSHYGKLDILVNNAAGNFLCSAENLSYNAFKTVMDIDTLGTFNVSKAVYEMYFKNNGGNIVNISANLDFRGTILQVHAGSAKAAINAMIKHLAVEWGQKGIRVNGISPGPISGTEGMRRLGGKRRDYSDTFESIPLQRMGLKTEMAEGVVFLASDASSYVTGTVLVADGGYRFTNSNNPGMIKLMGKM